MRAASHRHPTNASILTRYADALYHGGQVAVARATYRRALELDAGEFQAWYGCGMTEFSLRAYAAAIACLHRAADIAPNDTDVQLYLGHSLFNLGQVDAAIDAFERAANTEDPTLRRQALRHIAVIIPGGPLHGNAAILRARRRWARLEEQIARPRRARVSRAATLSRRLRIGYVSSFFHHRNWMKAVWGVINQHDRSVVEIHLFADEGMPSAESGYRQQPQDRVHAITELSNDEAAEHMTAAGIDVLVDLNGYGAAARLPLFMRKPAPSIVGWFNVYATTGVRAFDYVLGDALVIPPDEERFYSEQVLRVSGCYVAFAVPYAVPPVAPPPCLRCGRLTFGCLAPHYKLTEEVIAAYAQILRTVPQTQLLLKNTALADPGNRVALAKRFACLGIGSERISTEGPEEHYEFLRTYERIDIALDTFPYNGGTTTIEALWQGVPVLAFSGDRWAARTSETLLTAARLSDWVEPSLDGYVRRAIRLARSARTPQQLSRLRARLRGMLAASPACDTATLCRQMERHYRRIAKRA